MQQIVPPARKNVLLRELEDEVLMYDSERNVAHCLNRTAALVWQHCDGRTSVADMLRVLQNESSIPVDSVPVDEDVVWLALGQFEKAQLLTGRITRVSKSKGLSRRELIRKLGMAGAVALPLVSSVLVPTAADAVSCFPLGHGCGRDAQCCSGVCVAHVCA